MPVLPHSLIVYEGVIGTPAAPLERWSFSLKGDTTDLVNGQDPSPATLTTLATAARTAYVNHVSPIMSPDNHLTRVRWVEKTGALGSTGVPTTGTYDDGAYNQAEVTTTLAGGGTQVAMPLQTALAITLDTTRPGPTGRGRFFLPWPGLNLGTDHRITPTGQQNVLTAVTGFLNALFDITDLYVYSSKGYRSLVREVRVGRVPDTMRSRRDDLLEEYASASVS